MKCTMETPETPLELNEIDLCYLCDWPREMAIRRGMCNMFMGRHQEDELDPEQDAFAAERELPILPASPVEPSYLD
jgi:hypothetical protein